MRDVVIIGAGPVGLAAGIEAKRNDLDALILEKGALVNSFVGYPHNMEFFSTPELLEIGDHPFTCKGYKPVREEAIEYYRRVAEAETLDVHLYERVTDLQGEDGAYEVKTEEATYHCRKVVAATGFFDVPNYMDVPGEDLDKVTHYFREPYPYSHQDVAVIGARNSAAKAALRCYRHSARVTLVAREGEISDKVKYWLKPDLENRIEEGGIDAYFNTTVKAIEEDVIHLDTPDGLATLDNDWVLAMTGYQPNFELLRTLGIAIGDDADRTPAHNEENFETNRPGLYLAGTVCGGLNTSRWFIENGRHHAKKVMAHIAEQLQPASTMA